MKKLLSYIVLTLSVSPVFAQGWVTQDAHVVLKDNAHVVIHGATANYTSKGTALVTATNNGTVHLDGDWNNIGTSPAVGNNDGTVELTGNNQQIMGSRSTSFNNLTLSGGGIKSILVSTLVGGGFSDAKNGKLDLTNRHLLLNSNTLIINNPSASAFSRTSGLLLGETDPSVGYSKVQWNVRSGVPGSLHSIPFGTTDFLYIPMSIDVTSAGTQVADSGYIAVATYPTNTTAVPNNRPLPIGVPHLDNRYKIENDIKALDRFFVITTNGYTSSPIVKLGFTYVDREWDGSTGGLNDIIEKNLKPSRFDVGFASWDYNINGTTSVSNNETVTENLKSYSGAWVLSNYPYCPVPKFTFDNDCYLEPILFTDSSYIQFGSIDTSVWEYENNTAHNLNTLLHGFSSDGTFNIKRKVRGNRGCWDSITKSVQVYPLPQSSFMHDDTCASDVTKFTSTSTSTLGMPLTQDWTIDGSTYTAVSPNHAFGTAGIKDVTLITKNTFNCFDTLNSSVEIQPLPEIILGFENICERQEAFFYDSSKTKGSIDEWRWKVRGKIVSYLQDHQQVFNTAGSYPVQLRVQNSFGCLDSVEQNITVWPKAKAKFDLFPEDIYITDPFVNFVESGSDANSWNWYFGDFSPEEFGPEVMHQYLDTGIFRARLIANNDFRCADTFYRTVIIKPNLNIFIPNAFSPGPDNDVNTTFGPGGMLYGIKSLDMTIYTRWGEKIYHTDDIEKPWDGTYQGELVQEGTYLYLIKVKGVYNDIFRYSGTLTVIR